MKNRFQISSVLIFAFFCLNATSENRFTDKSYRFSFVIPSEWDTIPKNIIEEQVGKTTSGKIKYETGLYYTRNQYYFQYPYVLIWIKDVPQLDKISFDDITLNLAKELSKDKPSVKITKFSDVPFDVHFNGLNVDTTKKLAVFNIGGNVPNVGEIKGIGTAFIGSKTIVMIYCYALENDFKRYLPEFKSILNSFDYYSMFTYTYSNSNSNQTNQSSSFNWNELVDKLIVGLFLGGFLALVLYLVKRFKNRK